MFFWNSQFFLRDFPRLILAVEVIYLIEKTISNRSLGKVRSIILNKVVNFALKFATGRKQNA